MTDEIPTLPDIIQSIYKQGFDAAEKGNYDEAIALLENINITLPVITAAQLQAGRCHWEMHRWDQARKYFATAVRLEPGNDDAAWTVGLLSLQTGDFKAGWENYERRWGSKTFNSPKLYTKHPQWERDRGMRRPLVWCEQGIGDQILYASLIDSLAKEVDQVTVIIDLRLANLLQRGCSADNVQFVSHNARIKMRDHDSHIPIASLGKYFIHNVWDIAKHGKSGYIKADPHRVALLAKELAFSDDDFVVGLTWASTAPIIGAHKSVGLEAMEPLFDMPNVKFLNLQYGAAHEEGVKHPKLITTHIDTFLDLENVAAMIELCDVVVSPSGANVHLAGAMGKPVMLLDANKLWYWNHREGTNSLWYPSVTMFQRENMNAPWDLQVRQAKEAIEDMRGLRKSRCDTFVFFHVGNDISYPQKMVTSLLRHNPNACVIMCTDPDTPDVMGVFERYETNVDRNNLIYERVRAYSRLGLEVPAFYLDTDMLIMDEINVPQLLGDRQLALCERTFNKDSVFNTSQRGVTFPEYEGKTIGELYPYVGCAVATVDSNVWTELMLMLDKMDKKFKKWYGDQEVLRVYAQEHPDKVMLFPESTYGCLPEQQVPEAKILHFKGPSRKKQFEFA